MNDRTIIVSNLKPNFIYRITCNELNEEKLISFLESNGFKFSKIGEFKQESIVINLDYIMRAGK